MGAVGMTTIPPSRLEAWLMSLDGVLLAAAVFIFAALVFVACMAPSILARFGKTETVAATRPTSSNRKSGRSS